MKNLFILLFITNADLHISHKKYDFRILEKPNRQSSSREPKFFTLRESEEGIEVSSFFRIPFITIPVKRSLNGPLSTVKSFMDVRKVEKQFKESI